MPPTTIFRSNSGDTKDLLPVNNISIVILCSCSDSKEKRGCYNSVKS